MAANFWTSTHYVNWIRNAGTIQMEMNALRLRDSEYFTEEELISLQVYFAQFISTLARKAGLRQRVAATATVYYKRFYMRSGFVDHDPRLVAPVALYLAAKVEEHTVTAQKIINQLNLMYKGDHSYPYAVADIYDYEFRLISELDFDLVVFHPYRALMRYCSGSPLNSILRGAWAMVNDSYRTDVCMNYPPYLIAFACIYMAGSLDNMDMDTWMEKMNIEPGELSEVIRTIASVYEPGKTGKETSTLQLGDSLEGKIQARFADRQKIKQEERQGKEKEHSSRKDKAAPEPSGKGSKA
eukprot:CAMPEP_0113958140 /NCGR_PEP_ID=MMETSP0011_2-20120614/3194_1 /TAXON_ID=101924 /ORGANISM="Rhodosorus marinus" /LENGTH=296 /DNA_ID=CAMNT_0000968849 /DNA_START=185 /DNA_END=1075 /DNA_ORIENTATION=+ /assembly_acc=CAM_ASM_000156